MIQLQCYFPPVQLHIVHYNSNYSRLSDAVNKEDGVAVLGFMFEVSGGTSASRKLRSGYVLPLYHTVLDLLLLVVVAGFVL